MGTICVKMNAMFNQTPNIFGRLAAIGMVLVTSTLATLSGYASSGDKPTGEQVFRKRCVACHGVKGEGTKQYHKALTGSKSIVELGGFIPKSMPPSAARKLPNEDATPVAAYIYDAFYSPIAHEGNRPPP